jgi:hypothetical protein
MTDIEIRSVTISDVLDALSRVIDTTNEHAKALDDYKGNSWSYHGAGLIYERDKARSELATRLDYYIDARVEAALRERLR